jgi:alpha,alpha-trehalase
VRTQFLNSVVITAMLLSPPGAAPSARFLLLPIAKPPQQNIVAYVRETWHTLTRSTNDCASLVDLKLGNNQELRIYVPHEIPMPASLKILQTQCNVRIEMLPKRIVHMGHISRNSLAHAGLLYLPHAYVVPGGRFNEMYGWDSYFIIRGLIEDGELNLARDMVENFFFEIEHYGAVLNANRTYYLTRSQPPFLTAMILAVYEAEKRAGHPDHTWLIRGYAYAEREYRQWITAPKLAGGTRLSRYFDVGNGPVPEIADDPKYYATVADWLTKHPQNKTGYFAVNSDSGIGPEIQVPDCSNASCGSSKSIRFTADYYKGDRAMRESGFDISFRFGPFGGSTHHFIPICLNSLLYKEEKDLETMAHLLNRPREALVWKRRASRRREDINRFLWNPRLGMFTDFDFYQGRSSDYRYATTFYPLWAGLATNKQAKAVISNLTAFEQPGGICMSDRITGVQWDRPYAWAPIQLLAVEGMRKYGFAAEANRITKEFLTMVRANYLRDGTIREKYNALTRSDEVDITAGYATNVVGFGWTNGTFMVLLHQLAPDDQDLILTAKQLHGGEPEQSSPIRSADLMGFFRVKRGQPELRSYFKSKHVAG